MPRLAHRLQHRRAATLFLAAMSVHAMAEVLPFEVDVSAQALDTALKHLARRSHRSLIADNRLVGNKQTRRVHGRMRIEDALKGLLDGSGLDFRLIGDDTICIVKALEIRDKPPALPPVTVIAKPIFGDGDLYNPALASSATKTQTPLMETPLAIEVVPERIMRDQQITRIADALKNVSGVSSSPSGINGDFDFLYFRGFYYGGRIFRDGVPLHVDNFTNGQRDTANIARLEVVKGPPSLLYGRTDPGGMVNIVTKQPETRPYHAFTQQIGRWDLFRTTLDSTGPITADKSLSYRFNFDFEKSNSFRDFVHHDRKFFSPVLRWDASPKTQFTLEAEYREGDTITDPGLPLIDGTNVVPRQHPGRIPAVPISNFYGGPNDNHQSQEALFGLHWQHAFGNGWTLRHRFNALHSELDHKGYMVLNTATARWYLPGFFGGITPSERKLLLLPYPFRNRADMVYNTVTLSGRLSSFGLDHEILLGADHQHASQRFWHPQYRYDLASDLHNPSHPAAWPVATDEDLRWGSQNWYGVYFQDQIKLPFGLQLLAGFRYDNAQTDSAFSVASELRGKTPSQPDSRTHDTALTPRFGLLWQPVKQLTWYGNYSENFGLENVGFNRLGKPLGSERAHQWETGLKTEWMGGRLNANLAAFRIVKTDVQSIDESCRPNACIATGGRVQHQGLELDIKGEILPRWKVIGAYALLDTRVLRTTLSFDGVLPAGSDASPTPAHMGSLWTTYEWSGGFVVGAGTLIRSPLRDGVREPGYALLNLMAACHFSAGASQVTLQLNVDNVLDKTYYLGSDYWKAAVYPGAPRNLMGSVRVEW